MAYTGVWGPADATEGPRGYGHGVTQPVRSCFLAAGFPSPLPVTPENKMEQRKLYLPKIEKFQEEKGS